jgi:hypothetical protein
MENELLRDIKKRLEVMINLMLQEKAAGSERFSLRDQIALLDGFGLKPKEIAEIIGRANTYVNKELSGLRKLKK